MARSPILVLSSGLVLAALGEAAAARKIAASDRFDGHWTVTALATSGPCAKSTHYSVNIKNGDASIPGEVDIDGGVSAGGAVQATIVQGANRVPIAGQLDPNGSGTGTWHTSGGLVTCSGNWSAKRSG
ncbi:heme utilization protein [Methylobacterium sp. NEAU 140]|uniref:heme utilization protein n=1 Tax=Methylobacterium sp. NEAU 140 TaxID=3064945 RepID=UPI0027374A24|nr:heme utilization protein [Methylobacterium sp. NEAU 140]MDP4024944.1 heme utilization protein [Methylobacterium sp. NEAU 140]